MTQENLTRNGGTKLGERNKSRVCSGKVEELTGRRRIDEAG